MKGCFMAGVALLGAVSLSNAAVDCTEKVEQVLSDGYNVGWKMANWPSIRTVATNGFESATHPENVKAWYSLILTAVSTGQSVVVRYGSLSSCNEVPGSTDPGYYYRLQSN
jgi:hypothetical protein